MRRENLNFCSAQGATDHASSLHKRNLNEAQQPVASKPPSHQSSFLVEKMGQTFEVHIFSPKEKLHVLALDAFLASCSPTLLHSLHIFAYAYSRQYASTHFSWTDFTTVGREWYPNLYTAGTRKWVFLEEEIFFFESHHLQVPAISFSEGLWHDCWFLPNMWMTFFQVNSFITLD